MWTKPSDVPDSVIWRRPSKFTTKNMRRFSSWTVRWWTELFSDQLARRYCTICTILTDDSIGVWDTLNAPKTHCNTLYIWNTITYTWMEKKKYTNRYYENEMFTATLLFNLLLFKERKKEGKKLHSQLLFTIELHYGIYFIREYYSRQ